MKRRGFTLVELLLAVLMLGLMSAVSIVSYRAVISGWRVSRDYMDRLERTDYVLDQLVSGLKCAYYPHGGEQNYDYGFQLTDNGDGDNPRTSDVIEWTKKGSALIGGSAAADTVHRIQLQVLEEGDSTWGERIERTGLYARVRPLAKVMKESTNTKDDEFTFQNNELYRPILIAKDIDGFNCRVLATEPDDSGGKKKEDVKDFEDEFAASNTVPYKIQMTFYLQKEDPDYASRRIRIPILRTVRFPLHEQSLDASVLPGAEKDTKSTKRSTAPSKGRGS